MGQIHKPKSHSDLLFHAYITITSTLKAKHITFLISPLAGWTGFHYRHFTQMMSDVHVNSKKILVSLIHYLCINNPVWYIISPAAVARFTFGQTRWTLEVRVNEQQDGCKTRKL